VYTLLGSTSKAHCSVQ